MVYPWHTAQLELSARLYRHIVLTNGGRVETMLISCILLSCVFIVLTALIGLYATSDNKVGKSVVIGAIHVFVIMCVLPQSILECLLTFSPGKLRPRL
jgi:hypothetical protein